MIEELALYQKTYDLYLYTHKFVRKFPKSERFLISLALQQELLEAIKLMVKANLQRDPQRRQQYQEEIEGRLRTYLTVLRLAHDLKLLPKRKYAFASSLMSEILRLLSGWKESNRK